MKIDDAPGFVANNDRTVLVTRRRDGQSQMSPVTSGVINGRVVVLSRDCLAKVANQRRNPAAADSFGPSVQIDKQAEIVDQSEALDLLDRVYRAIAGKHPDWAEYRRAIADRRVVIRITPERASGQLG